MGLFRNTKQSLSSFTKGIKIYILTKSPGDPCAQFKFEKHCFKLLAQNWLHTGNSWRFKKLLMPGSLAQRFLFNFSGVQPGIQKILDDSNVQVGLKISELVLSHHNQL